MGRGGLDLRQRGFVIAGAGFVAIRALSPTGLATMTPCTSNHHPSPAPANALASCLPASAGTTTRRTNYSCAPCSKKPLRPSCPAPRQTPPTNKPSPYPHEDHDRPPQPLAAWQRPCRRAGVTASLHGPTNLRAQHRSVTPRRQPFWRSPSTQPLGSPHSPGTNCPPHVRTVRRRSAGLPALRGACRFLTNTVALRGGCSPSGQPPHTRSEQP